MTLLYLSVAAPAWIRAALARIASVPESSRSTRRVATTANRSEFGPTLHPPVIDLFAERTFCCEGGRRTSLGDLAYHLGAMTVEEEARALLRNARSGKLGGDLVEVEFLEKISSQRQIAGAACTAHPSLAFGLEVLAGNIRHRIIGHRRLDCHLHIVDRRAGSIAAQDQ